MEEWEKEGGGEEKRERRRGKKPQRIKKKDKKKKRGSRQEEIYPGVLLRRGCSNVTAAKELTRQRSSCR